MGLLFSTLDPYRPTFKALTDACYREIKTVTMADFSRRGPSFDPQKPGDDFFRELSRRGDMFRLDLKDLGTAISLDRKITLQTTGISSLDPLIQYLWSEYQRIYQVDRSYPVDIER